MQHLANSIITLILLISAGFGISISGAQTSPIQQITQEAPNARAFDPVDQTNRRVIALPASYAETAGDFASPQLIAWLTNMIRESLPPAYEDNKKWGLQNEVLDGVESMFRRLLLATQVVMVIATT